MVRFDRTIPPGGEGKITLQVSTKGFQGNMQRKARIFTNDPRHPHVTITMKGEVWAPIRVTPRYVRLRGVSGEKIEEVVHLEREKEEPLTVKLASVSIPDKVEVELVEIAKGRSYELKVRNKLEKETTYGGQVQLTTNYPEKPEIVIRISGYVQAALEVRPKTLSFGRISKKQLQQLQKDGRNVRRPVMVLLNNGNDLEIKNVELRKSLFRAISKKVSPGAVQILVEPVLEKLKDGPNTDCLRILTNQKDREVLEVPISFEVL